MRLANKVALITGAGSGFGRASAQLFAREGCKVVVVDLREEAGRETVAAIQADGGEASFVKADVAEASDAEGMVRAAVEAYGHLDIVFNNAGIPMRPTPAEDVDEAVWERLFAINVKGVWHGCKYAIPVMKAQGAGVILNTASTAAVRPGRLRRDEGRRDYPDPGPRSRAGPAPDSGLLDQSRCREYPDAPRLPPTGS
jgi:3-oxoacyl-[acyl-carrier protein] reductase